MRLTHNATRIVRESDGAAPGMGAAFLRLLIPSVLAWMSSGVGSLLDYGWALRDPRRQTLHDKAAGMLVVSRARKRRMQRRRSLRRRLRREARVLD